MKIERNNRYIILIAGLIVVAFTFLAVFILVQERTHIEETYEKNLLNIAKIVATDQNVITKLKNQDLSLDDDVDTYYENVEELSLVIILDMNNIRYTHPDESMLNNECDQIEVSDIYHGESYVGDYVNSDGEASMRAFVPIYDEDGIQIGVASVGILDSIINANKRHLTVTILLGFGVGEIVALLALYWITRRFKSDLFGFTTTEIGLLYAENKSIIEQLNEAVISIDEKYVITTLNNTAQKMFHLTENEIGKKVHDVFPHVDFKEIISKDEQIINKYRKINDEKYLMNAFPLYHDENIIGATAVFRSHLEVDTLLDQITGYQQIAKALRSQKHEFQNKLHVVLGLIKMKDYSKAENYIMENVYTTNLASDYYSSRIKDDRILALFVGKEIQSKEFNASLMLTSDSYLSKSHTPINSDDIVLVLGNLIDNSFEAYGNKDLEHKPIVVDVFESEESIKITVIDQAGGIAEEVKDKMFERGVSTKNGDSRGTGLSLVKEILHVYQGEKNVTSSKEETKIEIILKKVIS